MTTTRELQEKYPEIFKNIGGIIYNLNKIETLIITTLSIFFTDISNPQSEKNFIFNDAMADENVFPSIENKRRLLVKVIKGVWRVCEENGICFEKKRWLDICESIKRLQNIRNNLAHHHLVFPNEGGVGYYVRKSNEELPDDKKQKKPGSMKLVKFDLDKEFKESEKISKDSEELIKLTVGALNKLNLITEKQSGAK